MSKNKPSKKLRSGVHAGVTYACTSSATGNVVFQADSANYSQGMMDQFGAICLGGGPSFHWSVSRY